MTASPWQHVLRHVRVHAPSLVVLGLATLAGIAVEVLSPWPLKLIVDHVFTSAPLPAHLGWLSKLPGASTPAALLLWLAASTVVLFVVRRIVEIAESYLQAGVGARMVYGLARELFDRLQRLSLRFHSRQQSGDLVRRVLSDSDALRAIVLGVALPALSSFVTLLTMIAILWQLDPVMALLALVALPPILLLIRGFAKPLTERAYEQQQLEGELMARAEQALSATAAVQAFAAEGEETERYREVTRGALRAHQRVAVSSLGFNLTVQSVTVTATAAMMALGGLHVLDRSLTVGSLLVFLAYLGSLYGPVETLAQLSSGVAAAAAKARRVSEALLSEDFVRDPPNARPIGAILTRPIGSVRIRGVVFGYEPDRPVLHDVNLEIAPGETLALVGPTGGGKSTLLTLVPRLFDPWRGAIEVGGVDIREVELRSLREQIAIVLQEPFLLPLTVAENIAYGRPDADFAAIVAAAEAAQADDFIRALPRGYETTLGERGVDLSGGQRQRLAIARAILKDAPILLLDEPTASLDVGTEARLMAAIERLRRGRTTLVIAHRLSTVRSADRVAVLDHGRIVEQGSPSELMAVGGRFRDLYERQLVAAPTEAAGDGTA